MKNKWPLFLGIVLLMLGIVLGKTLNIEHLPLATILSGVAFKIYYIAQKIRSGEYRPGFEVLLLIVGLILFTGGIMLKKNGIIEDASALKIVGISLKVSFIVMFIIKTRSNRNLKNIPEYAKTKLE